MKKGVKSVLAIFLALTVAFSAFAALTAFAQENEIAEALSSFAVTASGNGKNSTELGTVSWWKSEVDGKYYMFMPSNTSLDSVKVWFTAESDVYCGTQKLENGKATTAFANGSEFTLTVGESTYTVVFITSSELPTMYINTPEGGLDRIHADKSHKEKGCTMLAIDENGEVDYDSTLASMKGRGNSTWGKAKKPYNIKLDSKTKLFGMEKAKNWCLIANYEDLSLLRNQIVYALGADIGMTSTPDCRSVDLYINGEYMGVYLVTEKIEIDKNRVDITDLEKATEKLNDSDLDTFEQQGVTGEYSRYIEGTQKWFNIPINPENITGGYLLELELGGRYNDEPSGFTTEGGQHVIVKSPEYASEAQVKYISAYWQEMEDALYSDTGYNSLGKHYSEYIDIESYARQYLIEEWSGDWDAGITSNYFYKDVDGKIYAGPIWDFDSAAANSKAPHTISDPTQWNARTRTLWYNALIGSNSVKSVPNIYALGFRHADFLEEVEDEWESNFYPAVQTMLDSKLDGYVEQIKGAAVMNAIRWNYYSTTDIAVISEKYLEDVAEVEDFLVARTAFLNGNLNLQSAGLTVDHIPSQKRTGSAITPELTVRCLDRVLEQGVDYTVEFTDNTKKGTATVTVTGIGDYEGMSVQTTFEITVFIDPCDWAGGACFPRIKTGLESFAAKCIDVVEMLVYFVTKPFEK